MPVVSVVRATALAAIVAFRVPLARLERVTFPERSVPKVITGSLSIVVVASMVPAVIVNALATSLSAQVNPNEPELASSPFSMVVPKVVEIASAATVIPVPAPMLRVTSPVVPPSVKPLPATTLVMSPPPPPEAEIVSTSSAVKSTSIPEPSAICRVSDEVMV